MKLALLIFGYIGSFTIWPLYQLIVRRWTRCSLYLSVCFALHLCAVAGVYAWIHYERQVSQDWWMMVVLYPAVGIFFGVVELAVIAFSHARVRTS
jgi:hypothetical protein